jgi:hypothetical protein
MHYLAVRITIKIKFRRFTMKMDAVPSQVYYPSEVNAGQRAITNQLSTPKIQTCCFEAEMASGNFVDNETGTPMATRQPEEFCCSPNERYLRGFSDIQPNSFNVMNSIDQATVDQNFDEFSGAIRTEIGTIPDNETLNAIEADVRTFETSVKEALDSFANELLSLVQEQTNLFTMAFEGLISAISGHFNSDDSLPAVEVPDDGSTPVAEIPDDDSNPVAEVSDSENAGVVADSATTGPQPFNFDEFEMNLREKFTAALDELLKRFREATSVQADFVAITNGGAFASITENYDQIMESTHSNNQESENGTFTTSA